MKNYRLSPIGNNDRTLHEGTDPRAVAEFISRHQTEKGESDQLIHLSINLPISFTGKVVREPNKPDMVVLECGGVTKAFERRDHRNDWKPGSMPATCDGSGSNVLLDSIPITFRDNKDELTDRGIVWVIPGERAQAQVVFHSDRRTSTDTTAKVIANIIAEAEKTVDEQVLAHFTANSAT